MSDRLRLVALSDIHGNASALDAVLEDVERNGGADAYWVLGDLVALGPEPVEALRTLAGLPSAELTRGNTDRYVLTGDLPPPSVGDPVQSAAAFAWTRGVLTADGWLDRLDAHPLEVRVTLPDGTRVLGVHASPGRDDGLGVRAGQSPDDLDELVGDCDADLVLVGHTHIPVDRMHRDVRLLNIGSVSLPLRDDPRASYAVVDSGPDGHTVELRWVEYDYAQVVDGVGRVRAPFADLVRAIYAGRSQPGGGASGPGRATALRYRTVPSVRKIAVKPTTTLTTVSTSFIPTLNASSVERATPTSRNA